MDPENPQYPCQPSLAGQAGWYLLTAMAALVGLALLIDATARNSATYDEVAYLRVAARWWRTGDQAEITRMGSPVTFWKLQQAPVYWVLDHCGRSAWIDDPIGNQRSLLPFMRFGSAWIWLTAFLGTIAWSRHSYGPRAMALAAWLFALSPNLIAHGALVTMELPLVAVTTAAFWMFWRFLATNRVPWFWGAAAISGLAFSCKYTAILLPPILAVVWYVSLCKAHDSRLRDIIARVTRGMLGFCLIMIVGNLAVTGFARIPLSTSRGPHPTLAEWFGPRGSESLHLLYETPLPQDWVGFATQVHHQTSGGMSYLLGERRTQGWWYYYLVALAVKVPLTLWVLAAGRLALLHKIDRGLAGRRPENLLPLVIVLYLAVTAFGSSRNYGVRYLLPLAPLAIVWLSALGECRTGVLPRLAIWIGLAGSLVAVVGIRPFELTYFNALAGGPLGGRHILADSNLDWGQGLLSLARIQREAPEYEDITVYYFGDTDPANYGVAGIAHVVNAVSKHSALPALGRVQTRYLAVSASLQWGPWGPAGFFKILDGIAPARFTDDTTIAIYRTAELRKALDAMESSDVLVNKDRGRATGDLQVRRPAPPRGAPDVGDRSSAVRPPARFR
jgi:4-amino-4-deoxy-L-arabinose transferase-like glycosyltransferase